MTFNTLDSIESHIENATLHVEEGNKQLERAKVYQVWSTTPLIFSVWLLETSWFQDDMFKICSQCHFHAAFANQI